MSSIGFKSYIQKYERTEELKEAFFFRLKQTRVPVMRETTPVLIIFAYVFLLKNH